MRLGIIGLKGHQGVVLKGARQHGKIEVVAVSDDDKDRVNRFKKSEPLAKNAELYTNWKHLLEHTPMDICCVCDENGIRAEQLIALAERNIHIVTEKPLATTVDDLERIRTAVNKSKGRLTMLLTMRHEAKYRKMRELVQDGTIGEVCLVTTQKSYRLGNRPDWFKERKRLGGIIPYIGIHVIDLMRWITGLDYTHAAAVQAQIGKPQMKETESNASLLLRLSNGASATARLDYLRPETAPSHGDDRMRIAGSKGVMEVRYPDQTISLITSDKKPFTIKPDKSTNLFLEFVRSIEKKAPSPIPAEDCFYATLVALKARQAAEDCKLIELTK